MRGKWTAIVCGVFMISLLFMPSAYAYIDPGTAGMLLQVLAACGVAVAVFGKRMFFLVRGIFARGDAHDGSGNED